MCQAFNGSQGVHCFDDRVNATSDLEFSHSFPYDPPYWTEVKSST